MWMKTRVGFTALREPLEIRTFKSRKSGNWAILAQDKRSVKPRRRLFRTSRVTTTWVPLAYFRYHDGVQAEIGRALELIASAVRNNEVLCDLSHAGSADAWEGGWPQVTWP